LIREDGQIKGVEAKIDEKEEVEIRSNIVIGADGVESHIGRYAGIYKNPITDAYVLLDSIIEGVDISDEDYYAVNGYMGYKKFPKTHFYVLPRGEGKMTLVAFYNWCVYHPERQDLFKAQRYFMDNHPFFKGKNVNIIEKGGGLMPLNPLEKFVTDGVMLAGDCAGHVGKGSGAGTVTTMDAGELAGEMAVEACEEGNFSSEFLSEYEKRWYYLHGERAILAYYVNKIGFMLPLEYINKGMKILKKHGSLFVPEFFDEFTKSPRLLDKLSFALKKEGFETEDIIRFVLNSLVDYHKNFWSFHLTD
jgi:flavin-dependent dehydrogenase